MVRFANIPALSFQGKDLTSTTSFPVPREVRTLGRTLSFLIRKSIALKETNQMKKWVFTPSERLGSREPFPLAQPSQTLPIHPTSPFKLRKERESWRAPEHIKLTKDMKRKYLRDDLGYVLPSKKKELAIDVRPTQLRTGV